MSAPIPAEVLAKARVNYGDVGLALTSDNRYVRVSDLIDEIERFRTMGDALFECIDNYMKRHPFTGDTLDDEAEALFTACMLYEKLRGPSPIVDSASARSADEVVLDGPHQSASKGA